MAVTFLDDEPVASSGVTFLDDDAGTSGVTFLEDEAAPIVEAAPASASPSGPDSQTARQRFIGPASPEVAARLAKATQPISEEDANVVRQTGPTDSVVMADGRPTIVQGEAPKTNEQLLTEAQSGLAGGAISGIAKAGMSAVAGASRLVGAKDYADELSENVRKLQETAPKDVLSQVGSGIGGAATLMTAGLPGALGLITAQSQADKLSFGAAAKAAPELAAYWLLGMGAAKIAAPLLTQAGPLAKAVVGGGAATAANMATSAGIRAVEGQPLMPTPESIAQDALFGFGAHGLGEMRKAVQDRAEVAKRLESAPQDALEMAATDPQFRKSAPYDPRLIDAELKRRGVPIETAKAVADQLKTAVDADLAKIQQQTPEQVAAETTLPPETPLDATPKPAPATEATPAETTPARVAPEAAPTGQPVKAEPSGEVPGSGLAEPSTHEIDSSALEGSKAKELVDSAVSKIAASGFALPKLKVELDLKTFQERHGENWMSVPATLRQDAQGDTLLLSRAVSRLVDPVAKSSKQFASGHQSTDLPEHAVIHEIGHKLHLDNIGREESSSLVDPLRFTEKETALKVSQRAAVNAQEFVGETFAGLVSGKQYSPDVLALYERYGGPKAPTRPATEPASLARPEPAAEPQSQVARPNPSASGEVDTGEPVAPAERGGGWKQAALPDELRTSPELDSILSGKETGPSMRRGSLAESGAAGGSGGTRPTVSPKGNTPRGDNAFIRVESAPRRLFKGLLTEGSADVLAKSKNKVGAVLSKAIKKHVDLEQEISGQLVSEFDRAMKGIPKPRVEKAMAELEPYLAAKENRRPLPVLSTDAQKILSAWENTAERTGLMAEAHDVQVFDPVQGKYRPMHRMGRAYVPRVFKPEVQKVLSDPRQNPSLFNDLADALAAHRKITPEEAANELRGVASRFQSSDFMGNLEMARTGQLPELFYDYNLGNIAARFIPSFSERMSQIISYGQRLGPREAPLRENLWDVAMKESEDAYTQDWLRSAEDQASNLRARGGALKVAQQAQTAASGLLLSSPTTSVLRNTLSGLAATTELLGMRRSIAPILKAATDAQTKLDAREVGAVRDNLADFLHADQLGASMADDLIRGATGALLKYSGYNGSEGFVRTHAAATASQFAKDAVSSISKNPSSRSSKEALAMFKRFGVDAEKVVAEGADWKTGGETRKFVRTVIRESQGGYRFDQVPLWANSATGRFFYQFGRYGTQRARNIWKNGIKPLIGEDIEWHGKTMTHRNPAPLLKMGANMVILGEAFALAASVFFDRDRKDASLKEISDAFSEDEKKGALLASERIINDIIMSGTLGIFGQPLDFAKSLKDQSRFKNPAEPPGLAGTKAVVNLFQNAMDQEGTITKKDALTFLGSVAPGVKQLTDVARNVLDEPLFEAENDVRTLRTAATRWAAARKLDVPKRATTDFRKSAKAPEYEKIYDALLVGDADRARVIASAFTSSAKNTAEAKTALKASVKGRQPFRVGPFTSGEYRTEFMTWAKTHLPKQDYEQAQRVQGRYETAARKAGLW